MQPQFRHDAGRGRLHQDLDIQQRNSRVMEDAGAIPEFAKPA